MVTWSVIVIIALAACVLVGCVLGITGEVRRRHGRTALVLLYLGVAVAILCVLLIVGSEIAFWVRGEEWIR